MRRAAKPYTIRGIPAAVDRALRTRARLEGRSLNAVLIEVLERELTATRDGPPRRDLSDVAGQPLDEAAFAEVRELHESIDRLARF